MNEKNQVTIPVRTVDGDEAVVVVCKHDDAISLCVSVRRDGDIEILLDKDSADELARVLARVAAEVR